MTHENTYRDDKHHLNHTSMSSCEISNVTPHFLHFVASIWKFTTKPFSGFELLHFYESVFALIRESISEAIKRKLSNRDYKMEKMRGHVGNLTLVYINVHEYYLTPSSFLYTCSQFATFTFINIYVKIQLYKGPSRQRSSSMQCAQMCYW
jgi:hypothetical protein